MFGIARILQGIQRYASCSDPRESYYINVINDKFLVTEACPEGLGTATILELDRSGNKTILINGTGYNRANLATLRYINLTKNIKIVASGYGETSGNAECNNLGDIWIYFNDTREHICSIYTNTGGGNIYNPIYDQITEMIYTGGTDAGWYIQKFDPVQSKFIDAWKVCDGIWHDILFITEDEIVFMAVGGKVSSSPPWKIYRFTFDLLRNNWRRTEPLVNDPDVELIQNTAINWDGARSWSSTFKYAYITGGDASARKVIKISQDGTIEIINTGKKVFLGTIYGKYTVLADFNNNKLIFADEELTEIESLNFDFTTRNIKNISACDGNICIDNSRADGSYDIVCLTINDKCPYIEVDPSTKKFRVIDFITKEVLTATVRVVPMMLATGQFPPLSKNYKEITVNGWTPIPYQHKVNNIYVVDVSP